MNYIQKNQQDIHKAYAAHMMNSYAMSNAAGKLYSLLTSR
jgi:hypothetical protein